MIETKLKICLLLEFLYKRGDTMKPKYIMMQATEQEKEEIKRDAHAHNMNVSEYIRYLVAKERKEREK